MAVKSPVTLLLCVSMVELFGYLPNSWGLRLNSSGCECGDFPLGDRPFVAVWNSPTAGCRVNFSVNINLKDFGILENPGQTWNGKFVTVFYNAQLGLYPYFTNEEGTHNYNGGMPQLTDLTAHFAAAKKHIIEKIPDPNYRGLAIIDWEGWRPIWERNFDSKRIYQTKSVELEHDKHPDWPLAKLIASAKSEFERSARLLMEGTLELGQRLRPKGLWGFYGFPDCFASNVTHYQCSEKHRRMNDNLGWLFSASTALFPSIYMYDQHAWNADFARGRLREARRLASRFPTNESRATPVYPYFRHVYEGEDKYAFKFLSDADLRNTIGQAAEMGVAGVVMWGNRRDENTSPQVCRNLNDYMGRKLGPYLKSVQRRVEECSEARCGGRGRCLTAPADAAERLPGSCPGAQRSFTTDDDSSEKQILQAILQRKHELSSETRNTSPHKIPAPGTPGESHNLTTTGSGNGTAPSPGLTSLGNQGNRDGQPTGSGSGALQSAEDHGPHSSQNDLLPDHEPGSPREAPNSMVFCDGALPSSPHCVHSKAHPLGKSSRAARIPKAYKLAIGASLGGALLLSSVYIVMHYYLNIRKKITNQEYEPQAE